MLYTGERSKTGLGGKLMTVRGGAGGKLSGGGLLAASVLAAFFLHAHTPTATATATRNAPPQTQEMMRIVVGARPWSPGGGAGSETFFLAAGAAGDADNDGARAPTLSVSAGDGVRVGVGSATASSVADGGSQGVD